MSKKFQNISLVYAILFGAIALAVIFTASRFNDSEFISVASFNELAKRLTPGTNPLNTNYIVGNNEFVLINGQAKEPIKDTTVAKVSLTAWGSPIAGDLNADGKNDAAIILSYANPNGKTDYYLAGAVKGADGKYTSTKAVFLGSNVVMQEVSIDSGIIKVEYLSRAVSDPINAEPKTLNSRNFKLVNNVLIGVKQ